jgi:hypothetical protein
MTQLLQTAMDIADNETTHQINSKLPVLAVQLTETRLGEIELASALIEKRELA